MFSRLADWIDAFTRWTGERFTWLTTILVILVFADAMMRYLFSESNVWFTDLGWHVFALIFLLGAAYALKDDQHVRVDVFYTRWSERRQAWVDLLGTVLLLIPWCVIVIWTSFYYAENAFAIGESSPEPGGLPARWVIKGAITLGFVLLLMQAFALAIRSLKKLTTDPQSPASWK